MKAHFKVIVLLAAAIMVSFSLAAGQDRPNVWINMDEVGGLIEESPGVYKIPAAGIAEMTIPVHVQNVDDARTAISGGFIFTGDADFWALSAVWTTDYPVNEDIACDNFNCCEAPPFPQQPCYSWFDFSTDIVYINPDLMVGTWETGIGLGFAGLTGQGPGMPADFNDVLYTISVWEVSGEPGATLTMDSTWWKPSNYWTWSGCGANVDWGGGEEGYTFEVEGGTGVETLGSNGLPVEHALTQNYPNPFNPITDIAFALPTACHAKLEVFNLAGQRVAVLADREFGAGWHSVMWDATQVASGVYLCRLQTEQFVDTKKMVLLK